MMHVQGVQGCMAMSATATAAAIAAAEGNRGHGLNTANVHVQTDTAATPAETRPNSPLSHLPMHLPPPNHGLHLHRAIASAA